MGVVSGGSSRCRPCSWKVRRWGTHPGPCAIGSSWRAVVASLEYVTAGWLSQEDHLILLGEFFAVYQGNHTPLKLEKCEFM